MNNIHEEVVETLKKNSSLFPKINILLGFDGFIDSIVRAVKLKTKGGNSKFFDYISEFGNYIASKGGKSCCIEIQKQVNKFGGNTPIMAAAFGRLGFKTSCVGALGENQVKSEFSDLLKDGCEAFNIADPGYTIAIEFIDGKVMLADMTPTEKINWDNIKKTVGTDTMLDLFNKSKLICMLNWGETDGSTSIWKGILQEIVTQVEEPKKKAVFFDLSDCSKKSPDDIKNALKLISEYKRFFKVFLGMNENEALVIYNSISNKEAGSIEEVGDRIYEFVEVDTLVIHPRDCAFAWANDCVIKVNGFYVEKPKISTGGGDNFNVGFCTGQLLGMSIEQSLVLANALSSFYVKNGFSPNLKQLSDYLNKYKSRKN